MKWTVVAIAVGSMACNKKPAPASVPWAEQPTKVIKGTVERAGLAPLAFGITAPQEMVEATGDAAVGKLSSPTLRLFHAPRHPGVTFGLHVCGGSHGEDPAPLFRALLSSNAQVTLTTDGLEHVAPEVELHQFSIDVLHVKNGSALCCQATYMHDSVTDKEKAALRAICESATIE